MINSQKVTALVPIKEHSERVPNKNFREFCGKPLYLHILETLEKTYAIDEIIVDTDSLKIMHKTPSSISKLRVLERPEPLRGDMVSTNLIFEHDISHSDANIFLQTHTTNPLLKPETIANALRTFVEDEENHDSLFSVNRYQSRFYDAEAHPVNHDPNDLIRTQDLDPLYEENSTLYIFTRESFSLNNHRIGEHPILFETPKIESIDIDDEFSFRIAELLALY